MNRNIPALTQALRDIPGALITDPPAEPSWISQAEPSDIVSSHGPVILTAFEDQQTPGDGQSAGTNFPHSLASAVASEAVAALAWYRTFRAQSRPWGIFIRVAGLRYVAHQAFGRLSVSDDIKLHLAYQAIAAHELTHFHIDVGIAQFELLTRMPLWYPRKRSFQIRHEYDKFEETLANASMLRAIRSIKGSLRVIGRTDLLRQWSRLQPAGYSTGYRYEPDARYAAAIDKQGAAYLAPTKLRRPVRNLIRLAPLAEASRVLGTADVPLYLVYESTSYFAGDIGLLPSINIVSETPHFRKRLRKTSHHIQRDYLRFKARLAKFGPEHTGSLPKGMGLERWPNLGKNGFSTRLNGGDRLHLIHLGGVDFEAVDIGDHRSLGHG